MQQSNVIFGALLVAFIVFITTRGELPAYISLLRGGDASGGGGGNANTAATPDVTAGLQALVPLSPLAPLDTNFNHALSSTSDAVNAAGAANAQRILGGL